MSINFNRSKASKCKTNRELKVKVIYDDDPYFDECWGTHNTTGLHHKKPSRVLYNYQVRMYRTWKHNRKTQYR